MATKTTLKRFYALHSVGCFIDVTNYMTYPMPENSDVITDDDLDDGVAVRIDSCSDEWYDALSYEDSNLIDDILMGVNFVE